MTESPLNSEVSLPDERLRQWLVQIKRDEESGPAFYKVEVRDVEADGELSKSRQATDLDSLRAMMSSFPKAEISARAMFGAVDSVTADKATDLLINEMGTRILVKVTATRVDLLKILGRLKLS
jgi:hypothetical protein